MKSLRACDENHTIKLVSSVLSYVRIVLTLPSQTLISLILPQSRTVPSMAVGTARYLDCTRLCPLHVLPSSCFAFYMAIFRPLSLFMNILFRQLAAYRCCYRNLPPPPPAPFPRARLSSLHIPLKFSNRIRCTLHIQGIVAHNGFAPPSFFFYLWNEYYSLLTSCGDLKYSSVQHQPASIPYEGPCITEPFL